MTKIIGPLIGGVRMSAVGEADLRRRMQSRAGDLVLAVARRRSRHDPAARWRLQAPTVTLTPEFDEAVRQALRDHGSIPFTALHRLEFRNSLELLAGRVMVSARNVTDSSARFTMTGTRAG